MKYCTLVFCITRNWGNTETASRYTQNAQKTLLTKWWEVDGWISKANTAQGTICMQNIKSITFNKPQKYASNLTHQSCIQITNKKILLFQWPQEASMFHNINRLGVFSLFLHFPFQWNCFLEQITNEVNNVTIRKNLLLIW